MQGRDKGPKDDLKAAILLELRPIMEPILNFLLRLMKKMRRD